MAVSLTETQFTPSPQLNVSVLSISEDLRTYRSSIILILYGVIPTLQPAHFGRVYAAYGGVFIVLSILWGWQVDKIAPDKFDIIGGFVALIGVGIIMYWPRS